MRVDRFGAPELAIGDLRLDVCISAERDRCEDVKQMIRRSQRREIRADQRGLQRQASRRSGRRTCWTAILRSLAGVAGRRI